MLLVCYDGSADSQAAISHAGELFKGQSATVLTVWQPISEAIAKTAYGFGMSGGALDFEEIDAANSKAAEELAREGAAKAQDAGIDAEPRTRAQETTVADAILREAADVDASAIVMGSRGLTGVSSLLLGSVSHAVIQHADRTVIVVPAPKIAARRRDERSRASTT